MAGPTSITLNGVTAYVYIDGYRKGNDNLGGGPWREVVYILPWGDSDNFMDSLMGINTPVVTGGGVIFPLPHQYPGNTILWCQEVWAEPVGVPQPDAKLFAADDALVHAIYRVPRHDIPGTDTQNSFGGDVVPWGRDTTRGYTLNYPVATAALTGKTDPTFQPSTKPDRLVPQIDFIRSRMMIPYLYFPIMASVVGCVNRDPMWGFDVGTVLFQDWDTDRETQTDGSTQQMVTLKFTWRLYDWNMVPREDNLNWELCWDATNSIYVYPYVDLTVLWAT